MILSQKPEYVLARTLDPAAIVIPNQADRPSLGIPDGNATLGVDIELPEEEALQRLLRPAPG